MKPDSCLSAPPSLTSDPCRRLCAQAGPSALWLDLLARLGIGVLLYGSEGGRVQDNPLARDLLPEGEGVTLPDLMEALYERAAGEEQTAAELMDLLVPPPDEKSGGRGDFSEIVAGEGNRRLLARVLPAGGGQAAAFLSDITHLYDHHTWISQLSRQHRALLQAIDSADMGVVLFDPGPPHQPVQFVNQTVCDLLGVTRGEVLGRDWRTLWPTPGRAPETTRMIHLPHEGGGQSWGIQVSMMGDWGLVFLTDMTRLQEQEEQLRHVQKLESLGQMAGGVAHDFNNILGIIRGYAQMVQKRVKDDPVLAPQMESIVQACLRGAALTERLLLFSRRRVVDTSTCPLQKTVRQLEEMLRPLLPPEVELHVRLPETEVDLACSSDHLTQILMNLVINARDAMPEGGQVNVEGLLLARGEDIKAFWAEAQPDQTYLQLQVIDEGTGIPEEIREKIFEPFFTTKAPGKGTGLGLSVVFGLVRQHQGNMRVHSEPGIGTTFTLWLPVATVSTPKAQGGRNAVPEVSGEDLSGLCLMVVDDEAESRALIAQALGEKGARVLVAADGQQALYLQDDFEGRIDALVSDVAMPELDGFNLARLWRDIRPEGRIVLISGYPRGAEEDPVEDAFLVKPLDFEELARTLAGLCRGTAVTAPARTWIKNETSNP